MLLTTEEPSVSSINLTDVPQYLKANFLKEYFAGLMPKALNMGVRILIAALLFFVGFQLIKLLRKGIKKGMTKAKADVGAIQFIDSFVNALLFVILILLIAWECGIDAASIVALIGSAGVAIGLAVQGSLSNLVGGILILVLRPFTVGDYIVDSGSGKEGTVIEVKIFHTRLRTFDNKIVILPNGNLANNVVTNVTKENERRIDINVSISYESDIDTAKEALAGMLENDEAVLKDKEHRTVVNKLGDNGIELIVRFWVKTPDYWDTLYRLTEETKKTLAAAEVSIPYPQLDVHMK